MLTQITELEKKLHEHISMLEFTKILEKTDDFYAIYLYKSKEGLFFHFQWDYLDQLILLFLGHRFNLETDPEQFFISGRYDDVVKVCGGEFDDIFHIGKYSSWEEFSNKFITYLIETLPFVLEGMTPEVIEKLDRDSLKIKNSNFHFYQEH